MSIPFDKRRFGRRALAMQATIEILGRGRISCIIHNISPGGAFIELIGKVAPLPREFGLCLANSNVVIKCQIAHSDGATYGITFLPQVGIEGAAAKRAIKNTQEALML